MRIPALIVSAILLLARPVGANEGVTAGQTLLQDPSARLTALGSASTALRDDAAALATNPAALGTLQRHQATFLFERGPFGDTYSSLLFGSHQGWGTQVGYYNTGETTLRDGPHSFTGTAQQDLAAVLGYGHTIGKFGWGIAGKYLSSELAETDKATALVLDLGAQFYSSDRLSFGAAVQNLGTALTYLDESTRLPRIVRVGSVYQLSNGRVPTKILLDAPYELENQRLLFGTGIEATWRPLIFRAGYRSGSTLEGLTLGMGFEAGLLLLDYSFGFSSELNARHLLSASFRFGDATQSPMVARPPTDVSKPEPRKPVAIEPATTEWKMQVPVSTPQQPIGAWKNENKRIYEVRPGDTLQSIAKFFYGREDLVGLLTEANRYLVSNPQDLKPGMKLVVPWEK